MANILVVDDEADMRVLLQTVLERDGHVVQTLSAGEQIEERHEHWADLLILDVMMPGEDGFSICRRIRERLNCPILFLTAKSEEADVLVGFGAGGDDYIVKPFRVAELRARVSAHLRRQQRVPSHRILRGSWVLDLDERTVSCGGTSVRLTRGEFDICAHLALYAGQTFSKEQIYEAVFGFDGESDSAGIAEYIRSIRAKMRTAGSSPIETVWGVGYRWAKENGQSA